MNDTVDDRDRRLLNMREAASYVGVSYWSVRDWVLAGLIRVVDLPALRPRDGETARRRFRRVLIDRRDLDAFIETRKVSAPGTCGADR